MSPASAGVAFRTWIGPSSNPSVFRRSPLRLSHLRTAQDHQAEIRGVVRPGAQVWVETGPKFETGAAGILDFNMNSGKFGTFAVLVAAFLFSPVFAQSSGNGWLSGWAEDLGIELEKTPAPNEGFSILKGRISDVEKAKSFLGEVKEGDAVALKYAGNVGWTVQTDSGPVHPCVVKASLEGFQNTVTLVPDSKTRALKLGPPPFKGSAKISG